jgi:CSLREA domain-containing protein
MRLGFAVVLGVLGCVVALSGSMALAADQTFVVNSQNDASDGTCNAAHCSLREAITAANAAAGHDTIVFSISGAGVHTILATAQPIIENAVTIDGTTEPGYAGTPLIELDGVGAPGATALSFNIGSGASTIRGLALNRWAAGIDTRDSTTVVVEDSYFGVSAADGVTPRPNVSGIIFLGGSNHVVGGPDANDGNLISGNTQAGVRVQGVAGTTIQGNRIGTNAAGTAAVGNAMGIEITPTTSPASGIAIGGNGPGEGNLISGNTSHGVHIWPSEGRTVTGTTIRGNLIGTDVSGTSALGNGGNGILIRGFGSGPTTDTSIGGSGVPNENTIAFNGADGISIETNGPAPENLRNQVRGNAIYSNGTTVQHLGIDLGANGVTANDALDADGGANDLQNFPQFTIQVNTTIAGELDSEPSQDYEIDIYSSPACDASGNGEGRAFVETKTVTTDGSGHAIFDTSSDLLPYPGAFVTATATDADGNTSELSACFDALTVPQLGPVFTVNTTGDAAPADAGCTTADCTLREAIEAANLDEGTNTIGFDIAGSAPYTITPATVLPPILETLTIDGETEPEFLDSPVVEIDGTLVSGALNGPRDGLRVEADNSVVRGLVVNRFSDGAGIVIESAGNVVEGSFVGTNVAGTAALPNFQGIEILGADNTIGGATDDARNVISGNESRNVVIDSDGASGNDVTGNYIGLNAAGLGPLGGDGISIRDGASGNTIGGAVPALGNVIAGNDGTGVDIFGSATSGNVVEFNFIGLGATGLDGPGNDGPGVEIVGPVSQNTVRDNWIALNAHGVVLGGIDLGASAQVVELNRIGLSFGTEELLGNSGHGILIDGSSGASSNNLISANLVADSGGAGIRVDAATGTANGNRITNNGIRDNGELGIDLADDIDADGVTPNDVDDTDDGANRFQNFPELTSVDVSAGETTFTGTLNSTPGQTFRIEYYRSANAECDPSEFGEGRDSIAGNNVTTDAGGDVSFEHVFAFELEAGEVVTAIAIDLTTGDTSEFSHCTDVTAAPSEMVYVVNTNNDDSPDVCTAGHCTLREAILAANGDGVPSTIEFALTDTEILLAAELPTITAPVYIDGTSQGSGTVSISGAVAGDARGIVLAPGSGGSLVEELWLHDFSTGPAFQVESNGNTIQGHLIWDVSRGVLIHAGASGNTIGGSFSGGAGNQIWNALLTAIDLQAAGPGNVIAGNTIGLDPEASVGAGGEIGIGVEGTPSTVIGHNVGPGGLGAIDYDRANVVVAGGGAGELGIGISIAGGSTGTVLAGNIVGTDRAQTSIDLGNADTGVAVASSNNNQLGPGNVITRNSLHGIAVSSASGNRIVANSIHSNAGKGISLNSANPTAPTPTIAATTFGAQTRLDVSATGAPPGASYFMELFTNSSCTPDGEGQVFSGFVNFTPDANGEQAVYMGALAPGTLLTVTLTHIFTSDTSEFSNCATVADGGNQQPGPTFTVNVSTDTLAPTTAGCTVDECTLREAIIAANGVPGQNTIVFDFAGVQIPLVTALPDITDPVVIDGSTQALGVQIDGTGAGAADGFVLAPGSGGSTIKNLEIQDFTLTDEAAIRILSAGNNIEGNFIHNVHDGVFVTGAGAANNVIGGSFAGGAGNVIWDFDERGIEVASAGAGNRISGNVIGIDPVSQPAGGLAGVAVFGTTGTVVGADVGPGGTPNDDLGNVAAGSGGGIVIGAGSTGTRVTSNFVGIHRSPTDGVGNATAGIVITNAPRNQIGPGNTISENGAAGVEVGAANGNRITRNSIFDNGGLGIDLAPGANGGIAAPSLFSATSGVDSTTIEGEHNGTPGRDYVVEIFSNTTCDPSDSGEGETFLVNISYTATEEFHDFSTVVEGVFPGEVITATVTDVTDPPEDLMVNPADNTSEFSNCVTLSDVAPPPAPILFGAVVDATPGTLGVAGLVDSGQPTAGQLFDVEFYSVPACDAVGPTTLLGTGEDFVTNETGIAGFAKDGLTDVPAGTAVIAVAIRGGATSQRSNCVVADFNNTSWHTARALTADDTKTGHLRASGEGRWFKVPVLASSRVDVRLTGLPADYDLIVFKDIQEAYDEILGGADPSVGPNLAITDLNRQAAETPTDVFNTSQYNPSSWDPTNWDPALNTAVFSASQWSASQWSASQWSASQWSASQWSASQWSASQWSASQWSASQWSASQWSASQWSASQWSDSYPAHPKTFADAQTRSLLAVSAGPGTGDESVSVNTWNNTGHFYIRVQGKNGSFDTANPFTIQVSRTGNLCSGVVDQPFTAPTIAAGDTKTLILVDDSRLTFNATLTAKLEQFRDRPEVNGEIVDVSAFPALNTLNLQADQQRGCPFAKNLVTTGIKKLVDAYRASNPIEYVVVIGDDEVIPFFRYPDPALLGNETLYTPPVRDDTASQASLRLGYVLSDDFLASSDSVSQHGNKFPVPDLASGRLVETPGEIEGMLDAYLGLGPTAGGVVPTPTSSLVTGYDFLQDAADVIGEHLAEGIGPGTHRRLVTEQTVSPATTTVGTTPDRNHSWTGEDLRRALLQSGRHDMIFLSGHFSANDALGADYKTNVLSTELPNSPVDFTNSIVFSAGCHTGYNIVNEHATEWTEPLDWAQAFARKRATLIAGTGYQYGDTDFMAHSERIYAEFARQLRLTHTTGVAVPVDVGGALLRSKQEFLKTTPGLSALDEKALLQTTLFGFPMLSVNLPNGRFVDPPDASVVPETDPVDSGPGAGLGLRVAPVDFGSDLTEEPPLQLKLSDTGLPNGPLATYLSGPDGVAVRPTQPILPLQSLNVTLPATEGPASLRGVGFRSGTYTDELGTTPLTAAPATELRGIHAPFFTDVFFPTQTWTPNYFDALAPGGDTRLLVTPVQHRSESPTATRRVFSDLDFQLFYSGNVASYCPGTTPLQLAPCPPGPFGRPTFAATPALSAPPTVSGVQTFFDEDTRVLTFNARVVGDPVAGIQTVWVTWTIPPPAGQTGFWESIDLELDPDDSTLWAGQLEVPQGADPGDVHFLVQAVSGVGRLTTDDNVGSFYRPGSIPGVGQQVPGAPDPVATTMTFTTPPPATVTFGASFPVAVRLTSDGEPVANKFVRIGLGSTGLPARTDADGRAMVQLLASLTPSTYPVTASFIGDATHAFSDATAIVTVIARPTTLTLGGTLGPSTNGAPPAIHATLTATPSTPLHQRNVFVVIRGTGPANLSVTEVFPGKTDPTGRVDVPSSLLASLPAGNYRIDAFFNGVNLPGIIVVAPDNLDYAPSTATATMGLHPKALDLLAQAVALLQPLAARPGSAGDKAEDALAKVQSAIGKFNRNNRQGALGDLEGAAGDLQAGVNNRSLTAAQVRPIQELITAAAWVTALDARQRAIARGGNANKIAQATTAINTGVARWAAGKYKDAIASFKDAVAKAEGA